MRHLLAIAVFAASVCPTVSLAQGSLSMAWDHCAAEGGVSNRNNTCTSNSGSNSLIGTFRSPYEFPNCVGIELTVDVLSSQATLPNWWLLWNPGSCRQNGLAVNFAYPTQAQTSCFDPFSGQAVGGIAAYQVGTFGPNFARIRMVQAVPPQFLTTIQAGTEYLAFELMVRNTLTVGTGACAGCDASTCLIFTAARIVANDDSRIDIQPSDPSFAAGFQCGLFVPGHGPGSVSVCVADPNCLTASRNTSWGQIKSLYR